jgi:uncharacterized protein YqeY
MTLVQRMRAQLPAAMKARDAVRVQFLRYWIAQFTQGNGTEVSDEQAIKKLRGIVKEAKAGPTTFTPEEVALIAEWVPASWDRDRIREALLPIAENVRSASKEGMALGMAMKYLAGQPVEAEEAKAVVQELRAAPANQA